mmetsp:Transcript_66043/g.123184  ORF Transcript_66043/g.123184 Transcript_66043/m.123184 type:complete len:374 (-) Transcript_66043:80-1201(-)
MGCGASAKPGGSSSSQRAQAQEKKYGVAQGDGGRAHDSGDCLWHKKNCTAAEMILVRTIREAYPFDENNKKAVTKKKIASKEAGDWGKVSVYKLGPFQINCDLCGRYILDRQGTEPFYYCRRCRSRGRKMELCMRCYQDFHGKGNDGTGTNSTSPPTTPMGAAASEGSGASPTTPKGGSPTSPKKNSNRFDEPTSPTGTTGLSPPNARTPRMSSGRGMPPATPKGGGGGMMVPTNSNVDTMGRVRSNRNDGMAPAPSDRNSSWAKSVAQRLTGSWKGTVVEGGSSRAAKYEIKFLPDGTLSGSAAGFVFLSGTFTCSDGQHGNFEWVEKHEWGTSTFTGTFAARPSNTCRLKGTFVMSDGGKGTFELSSLAVS